MCNESWKGISFSLLRHCVLLGCFLAVIVGGQLVWDNLINLLTILSILMEGHAAAKTQKVHFINHKNFPIPGIEPGPSG
jgi:hypothetical protein